jgi:hypothetical protein
MESKKVNIKTYETISFLIVLVKEDTGSLPNDAIACVYCCLFVWLKLPRHLPKKWSLVSRFICRTL